MKIKQPPVSHECIDGEVVIINMETGTYYSLAGLAASVWQAIVAGTTRDALLEHVATTYASAPAGEGVAALLDELAQEGLVDLTTEPQSVSHAAALPLPYEVPRVEKFTDLQDLLMLDPIHEVDAAGWPHKS